MNSNLRESFLQLIRLGIGTINDERFLIQDSNDWYALKDLADRQGLSAVVLDGVDKLPADKRPSQMLLLEWIGEVLQEYEGRYTQYKNAIGSLSGFYNQHGYKMMVLKGYACSLDWPKPEHRPCGDIDIWVFGRQKEADAKLSKEKNVTISNDRHHHSIFDWGDFLVENHYDFVNVHAHEASRELEKIFKELGQDDSHYVGVNGEKVYLPSPNLHALFLIRHLANHFASMEISLRQVLDWAFFVEKHTSYIDWEWLVGLLDKYHLKDFYNCINAICVGDLGFDVKFFPNVQFDPGLKDRIFGEIIHPAIPNEQPSDVIHRIVWKWKRWKANEWKHQLVYKESLWSAFWYGIWGHILKPASI